MKCHFGWTDTAFESIYVFAVADLPAASKGGSAHDSKKAAHTSS